MDFFKNNDPRDARVGGWEEGYKLILTRNFDERHYWFPFLNDDVYLYEEFEQNPGW